LLGCSKHPNCRMKFDSYSYRGKNRLLDCSEHPTAGWNLIHILIGARISEGYGLLACICHNFKIFLLILDFSCFQVSICWLLFLHSVWSYKYGCSRVWHWRSCIRKSMQHILTLRQTASCRTQHWMFSEALQFTPYHPKHSNTCSISCPSYWNTGHLWIISVWFCLLPAILLTSLLVFFLKCCPSVHVDNYTIIVPTKCTGFY
jgi:hypothetical protein